MDVHGLEQEGPSIGKILGATQMNAQVEQNLSFYLKTGRSVAMMTDQHDQAKDSTWIDREPQNNNSSTPEQTCCCIA